MVCLKERRFWLIFKTCEKVKVLILGLNCGCHSDLGFLLLIFRGLGIFWLVWVFMITTNFCQDMGGDFYDRGELFCQVIFKIE